MSVPGPSLQRLVGGQVGGAHPERGVEADQAEGGVVGDQRELGLRDGGGVLDGHGPRIGALGAGTGRLGAAAVDRSREPGSAASRGARRGRRSWSVSRRVRREPTRRGLTRRVRRSCASHAAPVRHPARSSVSGRPPRRGSGHGRVPARRSGRGDTTRRMLSRPNDSASAASVRMGCSWRRARSTLEAKRSERQPAGSRCGRRQERWRSQAPDRSLRAGSTRCGALGGSRCVTARRMARHRQRPVIGVSTLR